jgi:hypothetical protein
MPLFEKETVVVQEAWINLDNEVEYGKAYHPECGLKVDQDPICFWTEYTADQVEDKYFICDLCGKGLKNTK